MRCIKAVWLLLFVLLVLVGCDPGAGQDSGSQDDASAGADAGLFDDSGFDDSGRLDDSGRQADANPRDDAAQLGDAGQQNDTGPQNDSGGQDHSVPDSGSGDGTGVDASPPDAQGVDAGAPVDAAVTGDATEPEPRSIDIPGLVAHYTFEDNGTGADVSDTAGNALHGQLRPDGTSADLYRSDGYGGGGAFHFDENSPYVELPANTVLEHGQNNQLTVSMWVKHEAINLDRYETLLGTGDGGWLIATQQDSNKVIFACWLTQGGLKAVASDVAIDDGVWHHIAASYDGHSMMLSIDGQISTLNSAGGAIQNMFDARVHVSNNPRHGDRRYQGEIDELRFYNRVLTPTELSHLFNPGLAWDPSPADNGQAASNTSLRWKPGIYAVHHRVYLGSDELSVAGATQSSAEYLGETTETVWDPGQLEDNQSYYWAVDEVDYRGQVAGERQVWTFTTGLTKRVVLIGDSITQADAQRQSYRYPLWKKIVDSGLSYNFVGSQSGNFQGDPQWPDYQGQSFDRDHEGHWGLRADEILAGLPTWLQSYDADIAVVHVGTNDALQEQSLVSTVADIEGIIDTLRADNPNISILLAKLIPTANPANPGVAAISAEIPAIAARKHSSQSSVTVVDHALDWGIHTDNWDGLHPSAAGEEKMAQRWYDALIQLRKPRIIVSTDVGGSDPDDFQSLVHLMVYADLFDIEGLISSPPYNGRASHIHEVLNAYENDFAALSQHADFPSVASLRAVTKQGHTAVASSAGYGAANEGSNWIITQAHVADPRPLYVLVWGSITDVAQALHDDPSIASKIRVYSIGSWNTDQDPHARNYIAGNHSDLWWIENDTTFRGMYYGGDQSGDLGNVAFVSQHVDGHGALGDLLHDKKIDIKMGDTPSLTYLMYGNAAQPHLDHWGGAFLKTGSWPNYWHDREEPELSQGGFDGVRTVSKWREAYLRDWQIRMDWCVQ